MSDRPHPFDVLSRFVAQLSDLKANPDPDAKLVITRDVASRLGWELALALIHAGYRDDVATRYEGQEKRALDTLAQAGSKRERLQRAAKVLRLVNDDGDLVLTRGGHRRATVVGRYLWRIRVDKLTAAEAADVVQAGVRLPDAKGGAFLPRSRGY